MKICAYEGCGKRLRSDNKGGYCTPHRHHNPAVKAYMRSQQIAAQRKAHYEANRIRLIAYSKAWRAAHPDRDRDQDAARAEAWARANPEKVAVQKRRRRARKYAAYVEDYTRDAVWARTDGLCHLCGEPVDPDRWDIEHIVGLAIGGLDRLLNVAPAHPPCNSRKPRYKAVSAYPGLLALALASCEDGRA